VCRTMAQKNHASNNPKRGLLVISSGKPGQFAKNALGEEALDGCAERGPDRSQFKVAVQRKRFNTRKIIRHRRQCWV
jgi:hypothetical protein